MKKRILWLVLLAAAVVTAILAITSPLVQNLLYTGRRTGGSDRVTGTYELQGEDLTLKEPVFGSALKEPRTGYLIGRFTVKVLPSPTLLSTLTVPPMVSV